MQTYIISAVYETQWTPKNRINRVRSSLHLHWTAPYKETLGAISKSAFKSGNIWSGYLDL